MTDITCIPAGGPAAATTGAGALPPLPDFQNTELWPLLLRWSTPPPARRSWPRPSASRPSWAGCLNATTVSDCPLRAAALREAA